MKKILIPLGIAVVIGIAIYTSFAQSTQQSQMPLSPQMPGAKQNNYIGAQDRSAFAPTKLNPCQTYRLTAAEITKIFDKTNLTEVSLPQAVGVCPQLWQNAGISINIQVQSSYGKASIRNDINGPCAVAAPSLGIGDDSCFDKFSDRKTAERLFIINKGLVVNIGAQIRYGQGVSAKLPTNQQIIDLGKLVVSKM